MMEWVQYGGPAVTQIQADAEMAKQIAAAEG